VLGVAFPSISRFLRRMSSRALSRSDDSRESRAWTSGGLSAIALSVGAGGLNGREDVEPEELNVRDASCFVIEVNGS